jgi:LmbE family N-acetylglucosaminyl deacetylase
MDLEVRKMTRNTKWITVAFILAFIGVGISIFFALFPLHKKPSGNDLPPAVFFSPHPDDETLNMGVSIAKQVQSGRPVYIVSLTHGRETGALHVVNKSLEKQTQYNTYGPINRDQLELIRIKEFYKAGKALGVPEGHMFIEYLDRGKASITYDDTKEITKKYIDKFPNADFYALSWMDVHYDHRTSGLALHDLFTDKKNPLPKNKAHFVISMATRMSMESKKMVPPGLKDRANSYAIQKMVRNAMKAYIEWDPRGGSYAIGYTSVSRQFRKLNHDMYHYIHEVDEKAFPHTKSKK